MIAKCPFCEKEIVLDNSCEGKVIPCPNCKQEFWAESEAAARRIEIHNKKLIQCPTCGQQVSVNATSCPKCGEIINTKPAGILTRKISIKRQLAILAAGLMVILACSIFYLHRKSQTEATAYKVELAQRNLKALQAAINENREKREEIARLFKELEVYTHTYYGNLTSIQKFEVGKLIRQIEELYGKTGIIIDDKTGDMRGFLAAYVGFLEWNKAQEIANLERELKAIDTAKQVTTDTYLK